MDHLLLVGNEVVKKYKQASHHNPQDKGGKWIPLYYYRDYKKHGIFKSQVHNGIKPYDWFNIKEFQTDHFYKDTGQSKKDPVWDYYRIIKRNLVNKDFIVVPSKRNKGYTRTIKIDNRGNQTETKHDPLVLHFD